MTSWNLICTFLICTFFLLIFWVNDHSTHRPLDAVRHKKGERIISPLDCLMAECWVILRGGFLRQAVTFWLCLHNTRIRLLKAHWFTLCTRLSAGVGVYYCENKTSYKINLEKDNKKGAREVKAKGKDDMEACKKVHIKFNEVMKGNAWEDTGAHSKFGDQRLRVRECRVVF